MQKIRWTLVNYTVRYYCKYHYLQHWKLSWNPEHSWYWQSYLPILLKALHNNTTNERTIQSKNRAKMAHEMCLDNTTSGFFNACPWWVFSPQSSTLQFPSMAIALRGTCKKRIRMWLPSQFEVGKAQMCLKCDHLQFAFCWNDLTSRINWLNLNPNSQNWQKRGSWQIRECHQKRKPTMLYTWWIIVYYEATCEKWKSLKKQQ